MNAGIMNGIKVLISIAVIILGCLELLELVPGAIKLAMTLVGLLLLLQGFEHIKERRGLAIFSFCCALFILAVCAVAILG